MEKQLIILIVLILCMIICYKHINSIFFTLIGIYIIYYYIKQKEDLSSYLTQKTMIVTEKKKKPRKVALESLHNTETIQPVYITDKFSNSNLHDIEDIGSLIPMIKLEEPEPEPEPEHTVPVTVSKSPVTYMGGITYKNPSSEYKQDISDGDEFITNANITRTKIRKNVISAYDNLSRYIKEEIDEAEKIKWWGLKDT